MDLSFGNLEMNEFNECLEEKKLVQVSYAESLIPREIKEAGDDLQRAHNSYEDGSYKWTEIQSYYSMFHMARALLYTKGYRERSHWCLCVALKHFFVEDNLLSASLIGDLQRAKILREDADYRGKYSKEAASEILEKAQRFYEEGRKILEAERNSKEKLL